MKPLTTNEFIMQLAEMIPINKDDDKLYKVNEIYNFTNYIKNIYI